MNTRLIAGSLHTVQLVLEHNPVEDLITLKTHTLTGIEVAENLLEVTIVGLVVKTNSMSSRRDCSWTGLELYGRRLNIYIPAPRWVLIEA